jgi:p-hydroxybenzoate 3-monooxygenase
MPGSAAAALPPEHIPLGVASGDPLPDNLDPGLGPAPADTVSGVRDTTRVTIIGAGPAGLTLANLLQLNGIDCVVLETRGRSYVEERQRASVLDHYGGQIFEEAGLAGEILAGAPVGSTLEIRTDGEPRFVDVAGLAGGRPNRVVSQQTLVTRLLARFERQGGDLRFEVRDVTPHDLDGDAPRVTYRDPAGAEHEIIAGYAAGCDGFHGVSRRSIPAARRA